MQLYAHIKQAGRFALDLALPPGCPACGARVLEPGALCPECYQDMNFLPMRVCGPCGQPLNADRTRPGCDLCRGGGAPAFHNARAATVYEEAGRNMVLALKRTDRADIAMAMAALMQRHMVQDGAFYDALVPVPVHRWRLLKRTYNQAGLLAGFMARRLSLPVSHALVRVRATRPQRGSPAARRRNVQAAFVLSNRANVKGQRLLLIDDVMTTGHTANECAVTLLDAGAERVDVLTFARALV